jgi:hypothetical protein
VDNSTGDYPARIHLTGSELAQKSSKTVPFSALVVPDKIENVPSRSGFSRLAQKVTILLNFEMEQL